MDIENNVIKPALLLLFNKQKKETEAFEEISKTHSSYSISLKTVNKWFKVFRSEEDSLSNKNKRGRKLKLTDEYLISLVNENPKLNMLELAKLANVQHSTISRKLKYIGDEDGKINYIKKDAKKITNEFLINLISENPGLNSQELAKLADTSQPTISKRLKQINSTRPNDDKIILKRNTSKPRKKNQKITDENLIKLVNENPELNITEIAKLAGTSDAAIIYKLKKINRIRECAIYVKKDAKKFSDEFLINLIDENPNLNMMELAKLLNTSASTICQRLKKINSNGEKVSYNKGSSNGVKKFTDEFLINLINQNPELNMTELAKLANTSSPTIARRLKQFNARGEKVIYNKKGSKNGVKKFTDEFLINLINQNPELNMAELAKLANTTKSTIAIRLKQINAGGEKAIYNRKGSKNGVKKFTDEFLINLINQNPELNMTELAKLANTTKSTIARRLKQINAGGEKVIYNRKGSKNGVKKYTDEFLINLINQNPELNMTELAKLANTTRITVARRLKQINMEK